MNQNKRSRVNIGTLSVLLSAFALMATGCNSGPTSAVKVAGGTIDGQGDKALYPATVYVDLTGTDFDNQQATRRNVGTLVDVGLPDSYALILSLADLFQSQNNIAVLPIMKTVNITLYLSDGKSQILLPTLTMNKDTGALEDGKNKYFMMTVGVKAVKVGEANGQTDAAVNKLASLLFLESPLNLFIPNTEPVVVGTKSAPSRNLRDSNSSFVMIAIPKKAFPALASMKVPKILAAEDRPEAAKLKGTVVGFGDIGFLGNSAKKDAFSLSDALPMTQQRNYAAITALNQVPAKPTPLRALIGSSANVAQQMWEVTGSGLCGSKDGKSYDTGAAIYIDGKFAGFGVRSTTISSGYKGKLDCNLGAPADDMATLVISPSQEQIATFVRRATTLQP
jgi:hypothetical protein